MQEYEARYIVPLDMDSIVDKGSYNGRLNFHTPSNRKAPEIEGVGERGGDENILQWLILPQ